MRSRRCRERLWVPLLTAVALVAGAASAGAATMKPATDKPPASITGSPPGKSLPPASSEPVKELPTDMSHTIALGYDLVECGGLHPDGTPCNPNTETTYEAHMKWVRTSQTDAIGNMTTWTTDYRASPPKSGGTTTSQVAPTTTRKVDQGIPPPKSTEFKQPGPISASGPAVPATVGSCCSAAGIASPTWYVDLQIYWGGPSYRLSATFSYWWGGGIPGVQWGIVVPLCANGFPCETHYTHIDSWYYRDAGYSPDTRYEWYNYAGRGLYTGFLWTPTRLVNVAVQLPCCYTQQLRPHFNIYTHNDGSWRVDSWSY